MDKPVYVTHPHLPPLEELIPYLEKIWESHTLTNNGPYHQQLEQELAEYLGVDHLSLFTNGTLSLVTALQALGIRDEVITTPYSFVATTHALSWNNITPVFVDVCPESLNLDPNKIEKAITSNTTAILATHVYGHPCEVDGIQKLADMYGLKVIYDAAHAFGVKDSGGSILRHGDMSILSFHATKVFNTFEGGAIVSPDTRTKQRVDYLKNFGFVDEVTVVKSGINGKMNEFQAALGLVQLAYADSAIEQRGKIDKLYRELLLGVAGIRPHCPQQASRYNHAYFPIFVESSYPLSRDALYERLREHNIFTRRYFFPLISEFPMYRGLPSAGPENLKVAHNAAARVLCLPVYPGLDEETLRRITRIIADGHF